MLLAQFLSLYLFSTSIKYDLEFIQKEKESIREKEEITVFNPKETSEAKIIFSSLILIYRKFISSQDLPSCNFTFSCSRFGAKAVQKYGLIYGLLMTSDRLQRCSFSSRKYYQIDPETQLAIDYPVEAYYIRGKNKLLKNECYFKGTFYKEK
ncbi:MAG: membrane protein insertion efficiency factor YidD [candidate division WOR-3 bacterium]